MSITLIFCFWVARLGAFFIIFFSIYPVLKSLIGIFEGGPNSGKTFRRCKIWDSGGVIERMELELKLFSIEFDETLSPPCLFCTEPSKTENANVPLRGKIREKWLPLTSKQ